jgi:pSer/pThr/pTyr-binding forkhead associated (FHA) protein
MSDNVPRPLRKVGIADHLWDAFEQMAREMGSDREGLINQALFMFARLNGFLGASAGAGARASGGNGAAARGSTPPPADQPPERTPPPAPPQPRKPTAGPGGRPPPPAEAVDPPVIAKGRRSAEPAPPPPDAFDAEPPPPQSMDNDPARIAVAQRVLETAAELESLIKGKNQEGGAAPESTGVDGSAESSGERALYMNTEGRELERISKDRYLIGRGKHCDLVINSGKVSREHAAIIREGDDFYLQDLDSSNGTWFNKQRIKRRKIEDGDEYFICSDKVKFVYR